MPGAGGLTHRLVALPAVLLLKLVVRALPGAYAVR